MVWGAHQLSLELENVSNWQFAKKLPKELYACMREMWMRLGRIVWTSVPILNDKWLRERISCHSSCNTCCTASVALSILNLQILTLNAFYASCGALVP